MTLIPLSWMAPLMFAGLVVFMLVGFPVAFSLAAVGLFFGFLAIVIFLVWMHLVTYPEPGLFSDVATSVSNAPGP